MKLVSKDKNVLDRVLSIMNYKDAEYFIYRCFSAEALKEYNEDGLFCLEVRGDVAWSASEWFSGKNIPNELIVTGYEKDEKGNTDYGKKIYGTAHYTSLDYLARELGFSVELWSEELGMCFQQHATANGHSVRRDAKDYDGYSRMDASSPRLEDLDEMGFTSINELRFGYEDKFETFMTASKIESI